MTTKEVASPSSRKALVTLIVLLGVSAVIALRLHLEMVGGVMGVTPDSLDYLQVAENLLAGQGFVAFNEPLTHWPPGYSVLIAMAGLLRSGDVYRGAYWAQAMLIFGNTILIGVAIWLASGRKLLAVVAGIALFLISGPVLKLHAMIWSEAFLIALMLAAFIVFSAYVYRQGMLPLVATGLIVGLAAMVRYAGITLVVPFLFYLLFLDPLPAVKRIQKGALLTVLAVLPISIWVIRNQLSAGSAFDRTFAYVPYSPEYIQQVINVLYDFWVPYNIRPWLAAPPLILIFGLLVAGCIYIYKHSQRDDGWHRLSIYWQATGLVFTVAYILFIMFTLLFIDYTTTLDNRMFSPVYVMLIITIVSVISGVANTSRQNGVWWLFLVMVVYLLFIRADRAMETYIDIQINGRGYTGVKWDDSPVIRYVEALPERMTIYSNGADVIWFKTGRDAFMLPREVGGQARANVTFPEEMEQVCQELIAGDAVVVEFNMIARYYLPSITEVARICGVLVPETIQGGAVLKSR